jgi:PAS domain S-box-containing protein
VAVCLLLSACHPRQEKTGPFIEFTKVPRAAEGNPYRLVTIEGRVVGARQGQQIVLYARSGAWWVQPLADQPYTRIQPDSTWKNTTHPGIEYAALLVDAGYRPPAITVALPGAGGAVAAVAAVRGEPFFWQMWWFWCAVCMVLLALAFGGYRSRVKGIEKRERQFRTLAENAPDAVMRFGADLRHSYVNPTVEEVMGVPPTALLGRTNREAGMPEEYVQLWEAALRQVFSTGQIAMKEFVFQTPKGERHFESRLLPEFGTDSTKSVLAVTRDITDRKRAEETLRRSEAYLTEAQRLTHSGSYAWSVARREIVYWSEELYRLYGFDPENGIPPFEAFRQRIHPDDRARTAEVLETTIRERAGNEILFRALLPDGSLRYIHSVGHPVFNASGEVVEVVGTNMDVTERKRSEEEREKLRQAQADLAHVTRVTTMGELTASLAHEVNQPIAAAITDSKTCLRWLTREPPDLNEAREAASRVVKDATRAADIISRIRSLFKKGTPHREPVDLNEVIREMIVLLHNQAERHSITIHTNLASGLLKVAADRVQLQQVFMNLMLNGIEAMKDRNEAGELTIKSEQHDGNSLISVSDTGVGLDPQLSDQIFHAFFTTKSQGTGMGLPISRSIIESHGGLLWATANSGRGATFQFTLPIEIGCSE